MKLRALFEAPVKGVRSLSRMVFRRAPSAAWSWARSSFDYLAEVGNGTSSSTVMAPLLWIARTFPEAPPALWRIAPEGHEEQVRRHPLLSLLRRPNPYYQGPILWMATQVDWNVDGNAYWIILRDKSGIPRELWWAPSWMMTPCGDENDFVSHYEYRPGTETVYLPREDVVHLRNGMDPDDQRKGYSPLKSVLREVFTDDEAARFSASLLRNMGVPGVVVSPDGGTAGPDDVAATKEYFKQAFSGDKRGEPLVMKGPTTVAQFGFSPEQLVLRDLRKIPEERVTAVIGIPAIVAGLGAGLDRSTFTNMSEAREMAYESKIIPDQRIQAETIWAQLLSAWVPETQLEEWRFGFDLSKVRVLQDDQDRLMTRMAAGVSVGAVKRADLRRAVGLPVADDGSDDVYLIPLNIAEVPADSNKAHRTFNPPAGTDRRGATPAALVGAASSNGNGGDHLE